MRLPEPLISGKFIRRYKRFLADMELASGDMVTVHCANSGSMKSLLHVGADVLLSVSDNPKRKLPYTWELIKIDGSWVGVNTLRTNHFVREALANRSIPELSAYTEIKPEARWADGTRFDFFLKNATDECFLEVKNVSLEEEKVALFPDSITKRGTKHLQELMAVVEKKKRAMMLFVVNREDCRLFQPADSIDAVYGQTLRQAVAGGVEMLVYSMQHLPPESQLGHPVPFELG